MQDGSQVYGSQHHPESTTLRRIQKMGKSPSKIVYTREVADDTNITLHLAVLK